MARFKRYLLLVLAISLSVSSMLLIVSTTAKTGNSDIGNAMTRIYIYPGKASYPKLGIGETFMTNVKIDNVDNIYAFQFKLNYNPDILEFVEIESSYLNSPAFKIEKVDQLTGTISFAMTSMYPAIAKTEDGVLATVTFKVKGIGESVLDIYNEKLADSDIKIIRHITTDGYFSNGKTGVGNEPSDVKITAEATTSEGYADFDELSYIEESDFEDMIQTDTGFTGTETFLTDSCSGSDDDIDNHLDGDPQACGVLWDCLDSDPMVYKNRPEVCDTKDNDCDSVVDEKDTCCSGNVVEPNLEIDILDLGRIGSSYGSMHGDSRWCSECDIKEDNVINIFDLAKVGKNYDKTCLSGCVDVTVQFNNGDKIGGADVYTTGGEFLGTTDFNGKVTRCGLLNPETYQVYAMYGGTRYENNPLTNLIVDSTGSGTAVINGRGCTTFLVKDGGTPLPNIDIDIFGVDSCMELWFGPTNNKGVVQDCPSSLLPYPFYTADAHYSDSSCFGNKDFDVDESYSAFVEVNKGVECFCWP